MDTFEPGNVYYINLLISIPALCNDWGLTMPSLVPDIGIMAGEDIASVEKASLDAIKFENLIPVGVPQGMELGDHGHLFERLHGKNPHVQVKKPVEVGLGKADYTIKEIL